MVFRPTRFQSIPVLVLTTQKELCNFWWQQRSMMGLYIIPKISANSFLNVFWLFVFFISTIESGICVDTERKPEFYIAMEKMGLCFDPGPSIFSHLIIFPTGQSKSQWKNTLSWRDFIELKFYIPKQLVSIGSTLSHDPCDNWEWMRYGRFIREIVLSTLRHSPVVEKCKFFQSWIFFEIFITSNPSTIVIFDQQNHTKYNTEKCKAKFIDWIIINWR